MSMCNRILALLFAALLATHAKADGIQNPSAGGTFSALCPGVSNGQILFDSAGSCGGITGWTTNGTTTLTGGASTTIATGGATIGSYSLATNGPAAHLNVASWTIPTLLAPGYLPPMLAVASEGTARQGMVLANSSSLGNATLTFMASAGTLASPSEQTGAGMALNFMNYVGGSVAAWRNFAVVECGNRGGPPTAEAHVLGRCQIGAYNGTGTNPRPGVVVYNDSVTVTNTVPLWLYQTGHANVYDGPASDYERVEGVWSAGPPAVFSFGTAKGGTGTLRKMRLTGSVIEQVVSSSSTTIAAFEPNNGLTFENGYGLGFAASGVVTAESRLYRSASNVLTLSGASISFTTIGAGPILKQGANGRVGTFVCNGVTPVTVNNTGVAITDAITISLNTVGGTVGLLPAIQTITGATGFTIACTAADTSTYNYSIIKNAA